MDYYIGGCCGLSSINGSTDTSSADYLNALRKDLAKSKAKDVNSTALLEYILDFYNTVNISNDMNLNNNKHEFDNQVNISNSMTKSEYGTTFRVTDTDGTVSSDFPIRMSFWVM